MDSAIRHISAHLYLYFLVAAAVAALVQSLTLLVSPPFYIDGVIITDAGRVILHPGTDWALSWHPTLRRPIFFLTYLGPVMQDLAFGLTRPLPVGSRLWAMVGGVAASGSLLGLLRARGSRPLPALVLSVAFLLEPVVVQSYRVDRVDLWSITAALLAAWTIRSGEGGEAGKARALVAGALIMLGVFVWPSGVLLVPLVLAQFRIPIWDGQGLRLLASYGATLAVGGAVMALILLIPVIRELPQMLTDLPYMLSTNAPFASYHELTPQHLGALESPFILLFGLMSLPLKRLRVMAIATVLTGSYVLGSEPYIFRVVYLVPYLYIMVGGWEGKDEQCGLTLRRLRMVALGILLLWGLSLSLVGRSVAGWESYGVRNPALLLGAASRSVGPGPHRVYLEAYDMYYAGIRLGWHMMAPWYWAPDRSRIRLLRETSEAVWESTTLGSQAQRDLKTSGMACGREFLRTLRPPSRWYDRFLPGAHARYGPYEVCKRKS